MDARQLLSDPVVIDTFRRIAHEEGEAAARKFALQIQEEDGTPHIKGPKVLKVTNGDLTINADGTASLDTSGAGGGGTTWLDTVASGNAPGGSLDDEFNDSSIAGAWTQVTVSGTATWTEDDDVLSCLFGNQTAADLAVILKSIGSLTTGDYIQTAVRLMIPAETFTLAGLIMTDGVTAGSTVVMMDTQSNNGMLFQHGTLTNVTTSVGSDLGNGLQITGWLHMRLTYVSANTWRAEYSPDGVSWAGMGFADGGPTMTPTHIGLAVTSWGGTSVEKRVATFEYFRTSVA